MSGSSWASCLRCVYVTAPLEMPLSWTHQQFCCRTAFAPPSCVCRA
jgi:hypothetical protein